MVGAPLSLCATELRSLIKDRDYSSDVVDLNFSVTAAGGATGIKVVGTNAPPAINKLTQRTLTLYRFRPRLSKGVPVKADMQLHQTFDDGHTRDAAWLQPHDGQLVTALLRYHRDAFGLTLAPAHHHP